MTSTAITTFRCEECGKNFWPENGGRCVKCGRFLCSRHLFGWKFWRASTGQSAACQRCQEAGAAAKSLSPTSRVKEAS